jgi:hypothetical protein
MKNFTTIFCLTLLLLGVSLAAQRSYTLFKQCDSKWGNNKLGTSANTICKSGCAMSSVAMILNTFAIKVNGAATNPGNFNTWLNSNGGYVSGDLLVWGATNKLGLPFLNSYSGNGQAIPSFDKNQNVVLNVNGGGHFVICVALEWVELIILFIYLLKIRFL